MNMLLTEPVLTLSISARADLLPKSVLIVTLSFAEYRIPSFVTVALLTILKTVKSCNTFLVRDTPCTVSPATKSPTLFPTINSVMSTAP